MSGTFDDLRGRVAVVTGGAKGIGRAIVERLADEQMKLVIADTDSEESSALVGRIQAAGGIAVSQTTDLRSTKQIDALFDLAERTFGTVDVLVNNAAHLERVRFLEEHDELLDLQLDVNLRGPYRCSQKASSLMKAQGRGSIVHISSVGAIRAHRRAFPYDVTKGALNALTVAMAVDLGEFGIRVNAVAPGLVNTYRWERRRETAEFRAIAASVPTMIVGRKRNISSSTT